MIIYRRIKRNLPNLIRFGTVGSVGAVINFSVYVAASQYANLGVNLSSICAFSIAVGNNYVLNHLWTFRAQNEDNPVNFRQFFYYLLGNIQGLVINLVVLNAVVMLAGIEYHLLGQAFGILLGMISNFIFAKKLVFKKRGPIIDLASRS